MLPADGMVDLARRGACHELRVVLRLAIVLLVESSCLNIGVTRARGRVAEPLYV
jgi:hypothetical protein